MSSRTRRLRLVTVLAILVIVGVAGGASANDGDPLLLGQENTATNTTTITGTPGTAFSAIASTGYGVSGQSGQGSGVYGVSTGNFDSAGIQGYSSNGYGVIGNGGNAGVYGGGGTAGYGVWGHGNPGVRATSIFGPDGLALHVEGTSTFDKEAAFADGAVFEGDASFNGRFNSARSGKATVTGGNISVTVTGVSLTSASAVFAIIQQNRSGIWVRAAVPNVAASSFTLFLNASVPASTRVAWFVVN